MIKACLSDRGETFLLASFFPGGEYSRLLVVYCNFSDRIVAVEIGQNVSLSLEGRGLG